MRKIFTTLAVVGTIGLGACDLQTTKAVFTGVQNPVTTRNLYEANLAYNGALVAFNKMKDLCVRRVIPNTCRTYVIKGQQVIPQVESARKNAQNFIRQNPRLDASSLVSAYTTLIVVLQNNAAQKP